jgi:Zn-dependent protease with chaperone function
MYNYISELRADELGIRLCRPHNRILALQNWHFSNANQHLIIENQYFSNAERHLGNADRIITF